MFRSSVLAVTALALLLASPRRGLADEGAFEWVPGQAAPNGSVSLRLATPIITSGKPFVRLIGTKMAEDVVLDPDELRRGMAKVSLPRLVRGQYTAALFEEGGKPLGSGGPLTVFAGEAPSILAVEPRVGYPTQDAYDFEIVGERFGDRKDDNVVLLNGKPIRFTQTLVSDHQQPPSDCAEGPCLIVGPGSLRVFRLTRSNAWGDPSARRPWWPMSVSVEVDGLTSQPRALVLSPVSRAAPAALAVLALACALGVLYLLTRDAARRSNASLPKVGRYPVLSYLLVDPATNSYSLSKLQLLLWSGASLVAYVYLGASQALIQWKWALPPVPDGLPTMMGLSIGTSALAVGIAEARGSKGAGPSEPELSDYVTSGGVFAPERLQFLVWTLVGVFGFLAATLLQDPSTVTELPKIPDSLLPLMGVSSLGYVGGKAVRKPGPIVKSFTPSPIPSPGTVTIVGENLSPRAEVRLNGLLIPPSGVQPAPNQDKGKEFVLELTVAVPAQLAPVPQGTPVVRVTNPDGQSAEL